MSLPTRRRFGLLIAAGKSLHSANARPRFPAAHWEVCSPQDCGLDPQPLEELAAKLGGRGAVVKDGLVVKAWGSQSEAGDWLSSAKPVLSTLLLFAVAEGKLKSVDHPVREFGWELLPKDRNMTFRHLASMNSGYARPEKPGAAWAYNDYAIQLYQKTLFDRVFQGDPRAIAMDPKRLGRLGLEDGLEFRPANRRMSASVRDFARIAWFWLHKGNWAGEQILPRRLFERCCRPNVSRGLPQTAKAETNDYLELGTYGGGSDHFTQYGPGIYGFNWWFNATGRLHPNRITWPGAPRDTFMSIGAGGNCSVVIPSRNMVLACARGGWGKLEAGNPDWATNRHIELLVKASRTSR